MNSKAASNFLRWPKRQRVADSGWLIKQIVVKYLLPAQFLRGNEHVGPF